MEALELKVSPMMAQWHACKKAAGDAVLLFRMGDFYEAFYDDAVLISRELDLTLTKRQDIPMGGVPHHTCESYIDKLVSKGYRVAIAEQMEDPKKVKGLVKREVVRVVTPGTLINSSLLSEKTNNFFASITRVGSLFGLAVLDLTTADFRVIEFDNIQDLFNEIYRFRPSEFLVSPKFKEKHQGLFDEIRKTYDCLLSTYDDWRYDHQIAHDFLITHFGVHTLDGFGLKGMVAAINAAGALLSYLQESMCLSIGHIRELHTYNTTQYMALDRATQRNLELAESLNDGSRRNTLLALLDNTCTPMGARLLRHWVKQPLMNPADIRMRQEAVQAFFGEKNLLQKVSALLEGVRDLERLMMKISTGYASPRDLVALRYSFGPIPELKSILQIIAGHAFLLEQDREKLDPLPEMTSLISQALVDEPPLRINEGKIFQDGYSPELDELRHISKDSKSWIANYQNHLRETTGIRTIKVGFTKMFGYYIEVSKGQAERMPASFERRQTLVNAERFITPELKDYESKVLNAEESIIALETELFTALRLEVANYAERVQRIAQALARIDAHPKLSICRQP